MKRQIVIILHSNAVDLLHILLDTGHFLGPLQTEFHIAGRTVGAVVELDALMDLEFPFRIGNLLPAFCQIAYDLRIFVDLNETAVNVAVGNGGCGVVGAHGIQGLDIRFSRDHNIAFSHFSGSFPCSCGRCCGCIPCVCGCGCLGASAFPGASAGTQRQSGCCCQCGHCLPSVLLHFCRTSLFCYTHRSCRK